MKSWVYVVPAAVKWRSVGYSNEFAAGPCLILDGALARIDSTIGSRLLKGKYTLEKTGS